MKTESAGVEEDRWDREREKENEGTPCRAVGVRYTVALIANLSSCGH
jgi:hypothetical protein